MPEEYQKLISDLIGKLPDKIKQRITAKIDQIIISDTLSKALESELKINQSTLHEELPEKLMQLSDELRNSLPEKHLKLIESLVKNQNFFESLPQGKSQLRLEANKIGNKTKEKADNSIKLCVKAGGKEVALPQEITDVLLIIRDLNLKDNQKAALLKSLTSANDESLLKGFAKVDEAKEIKKIDEAEKNGNFVALELGDDKYTIYVSTNNGTADFKDVKNSMAKSLATIIIHDFNLDCNREIASAYERDVRVHNIHRAIDAKLKGAKDNEFSSLREMKDILTTDSALANKADSPIGIMQAMLDVIMDITMGTNRHDPSDKELIPLMYQTLSKSVAKKLDFKHEKFIE